MVFCTQFNSGLIIMSQNNLANSSAKKPYARPQVTQLGGVSTLTETSPGAPGDGSDGGSNFFSSYAS